MDKKLQVFVSSTYTDLIEERQAAVEAILDAGHIPVGMELFKAGKSQMKTIHKWIDESDVYMLILGGRYGSIEEVSGLSYTELEYKYSLSKNMPVFAVVLEDSFLYKKAAESKYTVIEKENVDKYESFKKFVKDNVVKFVSNIDQIASTIHSHLNHIISDSEYHLIGWVRNSNANNSNYDALLKENILLNKRIQELQEQLNAKSIKQFGNYSFDELVEIFQNKIFTLPSHFSIYKKESKINALKFFYTYFYKFATSFTNKKKDDTDTLFVFYKIAPFYVGYGLCEVIQLNNSENQRIQTTELGSSFYAMLETKNIMNT